MSIESDAGPVRDPLILDHIYRNPASIFEFQPEPIADAVKNALVVLDTNALLVPYTTGKDSLVEIRRTYASLASENRLLIPGQVAREFAQNRSEKLKTLYQQVSRKRDTSIKAQRYPLLESSAEYQEVLQLESRLTGLLDAYRKAVGDLLGHIQGWYWNDPVSEMYRDLFTDRVVHNFAVDSKEFLTDLDLRCRNGVPPGYKDSNKSNGGAGDLLIWYSILELGRVRKRPLVFVSSDEKSDWWHQSENQPLYPRFELLEEYRRESGGNAFYIVSFADLLRFFGASKEVVEEVRQEEAVATGDASHQKTEISKTQLRALTAVYHWIRAAFPNAKVWDNHVGIPHFVVHDDHHDSIGYHVRHFRNTSYVARKLAEVHRLTSGPVVPAVSQLCAFLVTDVQLSYERAQQRIGEIRSRYPRIKIALALLQPGNTLANVLMFD